MDTVPTPVPETMPAQVRRMVAFIQARAATPLSLRTLADALGRQEAYLGRLFRQQMGLSVREYVAQLRLDRASLLIRRGEKVEAVALAVGYRSKKSFYRQFVRRFGSTPAAYRARTLATRPSPPSASALLQQLAFRMLGPAAAGGHIAVIDGVEGRPATLYVAASTGGLWRTRNNGTTWEPLFVNRRAPVAAIAVTSKPSTLWLGTGEIDPAPMPGEGVFRSTDFGATWTNAGLADAPFVGRILADPRDPDIAYALTSGLQKTTDGGRTWTAILPAAPGSCVADVAIDMLSPDVLIAAVCQQHRHASITQITGLSNGIGPIGGLYKSENGGRSWTRLSMGLPRANPRWAAIGICRQHPRVLYVALTCPSSRVMIFRSINGGSTWERRQTVPGHARGLRLMVDPVDPERVYLLGDRLHVSDDGGRGFHDHDTTAALAGSRTLWIDAADPNHLVSGSHEGVSISYDRAKTWHVCRNLPVARISRVSVDLNRPYHVYVGIEGDGAWAGPVATRHARGIDNDSWFAIPGGGEFAFPDPADDRSVYTQTSESSLVRYDRDTGEHRAIYQGSGSLPLVISRYDPSTIYLGLNHVLRSTNRGVWWTPIGPELPVTVTLTALAESGKSSGLLYAGSNDRRLFVCRGFGARWVEVTNGLEQVPAHARVSRISTSWSDDETAYVAFEASQNHDRLAYVFMTTDAGRSWRSIVGDLPPAPVHVIYEDPRNARLLYAGTDLGLFVSLDRGHRWINIESNLPKVPVTDLIVHPRDNDLVIGTRGRGVWVLDDAAPLQELGDEVLRQEAYVFAVRSGTQWLPPDHVHWQGDDGFCAPNPPRGTIITYALRDMAVGGVAVLIKDLHGVTVRKLEGCREPGLHRLAWDLRWPPARHAESLTTDSHHGPPEVLLGAFVRPGSYEVSLVVSGKECGRRAFAVEGDPLIDLPEPARELQQRALVLLTEMQDRVIASSEALRGITRQLGVVYGRLRRNGDLCSSTLSATRTLVRSVGSLRRTIGRPFRAQAGSSRHHAALGTSINRLKGEIAGSASAPTPTQSQALMRLHRELSQALALVTSLLADDLPALNRQLEGHGLSPVRVSIKPSQALALREYVN